MTNLTPIRTSLPAAARRAVVAPAAARPPAKAVSPDKAAIAKRAVVSVKPKPVDTVWYRVKRAVADVLCNLPIPSFQNRTLSDQTPPGLKQDLKLGDVLLRRTEGTSGNLFIPSWWKHAAVYVGNGKIVEATFEGVKTTTLEEFFAHGDHVAVVRPKGMNVLERHDIVRYAKQQVGKPYDFDMNFDDDGRLSCTELAYRAVRAGSGKDIVEQNWFGAVVGDSFLTDKFEVIYSSNEAQTPKK